MLGIALGSRLAKLSDAEGSLHDGIECWQLTQHQGSEKQKQNKTIKEGECHNNLEDLKV